eukprot:3658139-Rhodomonas_salina.1
MPSYQQSHDQPSVATVLQKQSQCYRASLFNRCMFNDTWYRCNSKNRSDRDISLKEAILEFDSFRAVRAVFPRVPRVPGYPGYPGSGSCGLLLLITQNFVPYPEYPGTLVCFHGSITPVPTDAICAVHCRYLPGYPGYRSVQRLKVCDENIRRRASRGVDSSST